MFLGVTSSSFIIVSDITVASSSSSSQSTDKLKIPERSDPAHNSERGHVTLFSARE